MTWIVYAIAAADAFSLAIVLEVREFFFHWLGVSRTAFERGLIVCYVASSIVNMAVLEIHRLTIALFAGIICVVGITMYVRTLFASNRRRVLGLVSILSVFRRVAYSLFCAAYTLVLLLMRPHAWSDLLLPLPTILYVGHALAIAIPHPDDRSGGGKKSKALWKRLCGGIAGGMFPVPEGGPA